MGLADGKMGICIYLYIIGRFENNNEYSSIAGKLLDEIISNISTLPIDVKGGLAGLGLGVTYLIKNKYIKGNINSILEETDSEVCKHLFYSKYINKIEVLSLTQILYYLCVRSKEQKKNSNNESLYRELIINILNKINDKLDLDFFEESLVYTINYTVPQLLYVLGEIYYLDFYNLRLIKILEELSYKIFSIIPHLDSNKLYLLWGMDSLQSRIKDNNWEKQINLIKSHIDLDNILEKELNNKNIFFCDGLTSIFFFINTLKSYFPSEYIVIYNEKILNRIKSSTIWTLLLQNPQFFNSHTGLENGFCGTALLINSIRVK
ncbi:MAG: hypothetical protein QMB39_09345 [Bacteroidales bacterium]